MLKSWTDTHYKLSESDWLYIAKHDRQGSASLVCPGYARDGQGFSIHFSSAQIEILEQLVELLRALQETPIGAAQRQAPAMGDALARGETPSRLRDSSANRAGYDAQNYQPSSSSQPLVYPVGREK